jgi:LysM repeat protein
MDTISRESSSSYLPVAGVLVGVLALIVAAAALIKTSSLGKRVPENLPDQLASIESKADGAVAASDKANANIAKLQTSVQSAFDSIGPEIGNIKASIQKLEDAAKARVAAPKPGVKAGGEPVAAGPDEYVVKPGDTGTKIAKATGVSVANLEAANPGINWHKLRVGQKIKTK